MPVADSLVADSLAALLLTLTAGLDTALILRTATVEGGKKALQAAIGIDTGCFIGVYWSLLVWGDYWLLPSWLTDCLTQLRPTLDHAIPSHLIDSLAVDEQPITSPRFEPEADLLCGYGQALARLLAERTLSPDMEPILAGLLFDLVVYFAEELRAPRWIRTADGVKFIEELDRVKENCIP